MSSNRSNPPRLAIWWLRHACPGGRDNDALTGDLIERFREGQTRRWFWTQVLIAFAVGLLGEIRRHWPHFSYAIAGAVAPAILFRGVKTVPIGWWTTLPWPWPEFVLFFGLWAQLVLAALPVLAAGLGDQPNISLGQPASHRVDQLGTHHAGPLRVRFFLAGRSIR